LISLIPFDAHAHDRWFAGKLVKGLEALHIAPKGSTKVNEMLMKTADALTASGRLGIFNPCFLLVGRKPLTATGAAAAAE
jgi:sterol 24-C-methyltransferase